MKIGALPGMRALRLAAALTMLPLGACAVLPYPVTPEIARTAEVDLPETVYVTVGPRRLLARMSEAIRKETPRIEIVDALEVRDAAFPDGGWSLQELLGSGRCGALAERLGVRYLVLLGPLQTRLGEEKGFFIPLALGAQSQTEDRSIGSLIVDLQRSELVCRLTASASGTQRVFHYVVILVGTLPRTEAAVIDGMAKAIASELGSLVPEGPLRIAVLAAEAGGAVPEGKR